MAALTGELLALAGAWDPAAIALKPLCFAHARQPVAVQPSDGSITPGHGSAYINMITAGLRLMADYLVDIDVLVIKSAQFTLRHLLATAAGKEAFDQLDPMTKGYLQVQRAAGQSPAAWASPDHSLHRTFWLSHTCDVAFSLLVAVQSLSVHYSFQSMDQFLGINRGPTDNQCIQQKLKQ